MSDIVKDAAWFSCYKQAEEEVSKKYPVFCVCGSLCTSLHEMRCKEFQSAVQRRAKDLYENWTETKE